MINDPSKCEFVFVLFWSSLMCELIRLFLFLFIFGVMKPWLFFHLPFFVFFDVKLGISFIFIFFSFIIIFFWSLKRPMVMRRVIIYSGAKGVNQVAFWYLLNREGTTNKRLKVKTTTTNESRKMRREPPTSPKFQVPYLILFKA